MVAEAIEVQSPNELDLTGCDEFLHFAYAVRDAKSGNARLIELFKALNLDYEHQHVISLFGLLMSRAPLTVDQALKLKEILELGGK
ncbi:MAG: hypothetical protein CVU42_13690 [Chloroflexi bacterium HGW-Chloroflexi-4]|jgi:hypothetical protein|nr:MAG: hypothetical protein CVU42_13690 [Chloroflexi bacterium HGW-Chloroflexi-4]